MTKTLAMAALLAATAFTPALAQDAATAAEPTPIPQRVMVQMAQNERRERPERQERTERPERAERAQTGGERGGWQARQQAQPAPQAAAPAPQPAPQRDWNGGNRAQWQGRAQGQPQAQGQVQAQPRADWQARRAQGQGGGWQRQAPSNEVTTQAPAQSQQRWQGNRNDSWRNRTGEGVQAQPRPDGQRWNGQQRNDNRTGNWQNDRRNDGRNNNWNGNTGRNDSWRGNNRTRGVDLRAQYQNQYRGWNRSWSNDWRRDRRYDWQGYRSYNRDLFRAQRYYAPYGWNYGYQRFGIGFTLSYLLFDQQYWIDDPYDYRLPPADGPYRWVRYYDDVLLVDLRSGRVVDAIHDFFYDDDY